MRFYWLILGTLAVWRIAHLLSSEDGPWDVMVRLRRRAGSGFWAELLDCFYCLTLWISAPLAYSMGESWKERLLLWPAMSAGAILLQKLVSRYDAAAPPVPAYFEDTDSEEDADVVLRQEERTIAGRRPRT